MEMAAILTGLARQIPSLYSLMPFGVSEADDSEFWYSSSEMINQ
jgi:hypothetical protein